MASEAGPKRGVCVLGVSRSGTSAVAGMLVRAGFFAGAADDVYPADSSNPDGHHENLGTVLTNERLLWQLGGTIFSPPELPIDEDARRGAVAAVRSELERVIRAADGAPLVIKDPRIALMLPVWGEFVPGLLHPVLVVRHPVETAGSLFARDAMVMPVALAVWEYHLTTLLAHLDSHEVSVAPYPAVVSDEGLATRFLEQLGTGAGGVPAPAAFRGELYRNRAGATDDEEHLNERQRQLWRFLSSLPAGLQRLSVPPELTTPTPAASETVRAVGRRIVREHELEVELTRRHERNVELETELAKVQARNVELEVELDKVRQRKLALEAELSYRV